MPPPIEPDEEDEQYESSQDSDFAPDAAGGAEEDASESENDESTPAADAPKRKRAAGDAEAEDAGIENSGDEAIITKGQKRRKKHRNDDDEGGDGGLVKTRSMRATEKAERKIKAVTGPVTVDVDALWAQMTSGAATNALAPAAAAPVEDGMDVDVPPPAQNGDKGGEKEMIKIKRTYNFAGKVHTEEKLVARDSAEARLYLASKDKPGEDQEEEDDAPRRVLKKAFRSAFEPVIEVSARGGRADLDLGVTMAIKARESKAAAARKLNTVEKSRMDWAGYVDKEGLKDELDLAGRSKGSYNVREGFLARSEARREEDAWKARMAGRA